MTQTIEISPALMALCQRHGIDFNGRSAEDVAAILPQIITAVASEQRSTKALLAKSALHVHQINSYCPIEFVREENVCLPNDQNPNDVFSSLLPG